MKASKLSVSETSIAGAYVVESNKHQDIRGSFSRFFCAEELTEVISNRSIVQINHSYTETVGSLRGLHYQKTPHQEMKLVRCIRGAVFDVLVDLRHGSETFLSWTGEILSAENQAMLVIPEGCAHGFQTLMPNTELVYLHTASYVPQSEAGIRYDDPRINVKWPRAVADVSEKDLSLSAIEPNFTGI